MVLRTLDYPQIAVIQEASGFDNYGRPKKSVAREIAVRWEERQRWTTDKDGARIGIDATIWMGEELAIGTEVWLGTISDNATPPASKLYQTISNDAIPDEKGRTWERQAALIKKSDTQGDDA